jgi:hypothetical protein
MNKYELIDKVVAEIAKDKGISEDEVGTYDTLMRVAEIAVKNCSIPDVVPCFNYNDFEEAFLAGYKLRAEMSDLTYDFASQLHAKSNFIKWNSKRIKNKV